VVTLLQNATKASIYRLQNAKTVAKCFTYQWGVALKNALFYRLKNIFGFGTGSALYSRQKEREKRK